MSDALLRAAERDYAAGRLSADGYLAALRRWSPERIPPRVWPVGVEYRGAGFQAVEQWTADVEVGQSGEGLGAEVLIERRFYKSVPWRCSCGKRGRTAIVPEHWPDPPIPETCPRCHRRRTT